LLRLQQGRPDHARMPCGRRRPTRAARNAPSGNGLRGSVGPLTLQFCPARPTQPTRSDRSSALPLPHQGSAREQRTSPRLGRAYQ
jgi:hypothetical protein